MKRISIAVFALVACLAIVAVPASGAKKKKPKTFAATATLAVQVTEPAETISTDPYAPAPLTTPGAGRFSGQVSSGGPSKCRQGRAVKIFRGGIAVTQTNTDANGNYNVTVAARPPAGAYTASVLKRVVVKKNKKTGKTTKKICAATTSNAVPVA